MRDTPFYEDTHVKVYQGNALDVLAQLPLYKFSLIGSNVIKALDFIKKLFSQCSLFFGHVCFFCPNVGSSLFTFTKFEKDFCLPFFNFKERIQNFSTQICLPVSNLPAMEPFTSKSAGIFKTTVSPKSTVQHISNLWCRLFQPYSFAIHRTRSISPNPHMVSASFNGDIAIAVNATSEICSPPEPKESDNFRIYFAHLGIYLTTKTNICQIVKVAKQLGRKAILIDLSEDYCRLIRYRLERIAIPMEF